MIEIISMVRWYPASSSTQLKLLTSFQGITTRSSHYFEAILVVVDPGGKNLKPSTLTLKREVDSEKMEVLDAKSSVGSAQFIGMKGRKGGECTIINGEGEWNVINAKGQQTTIKRGRQTTKGI